MKQEPSIIFVWDIHHECNYRCPYCWFDGEWEKGKKESIYLSLTEWRKIWNKVYERYGPVEIQISGGEPTIYPNFFSIIELLSKKHKVSFMTNFSFEIDEFLSAQIPPSTTGLGLSFHPLYSRVNNFIKKATRLEENNFDFTVYFLAYPPHISMLEKYERKFKKKNMEFRVLTFWGRYKGKEYPENYTLEEKKKIKSLINDENEAEYNIEQKSPQGKLCYAGVNFANISHKGEVFRCGPLAPDRGKLGSIIDANFALLEEPEVCDASFCQCDNFKNLYGE